MVSPAAQESVANRPVGGVEGVTHATYEQMLDQSWDFAMSEGSAFFEGKGGVHESLLKITRRLGQLGIPYAVAGGMALVHFGYRRFTEDVDILVTREALRKIHEELDGRGFIRPFEKSKNLRDADTRVKIEFLITGDYPGDGKPKEVAFPDPVAVAESGPDGIKFVNLPTLVTLKLASGLSGADRSKDLADVEELIKLLVLPKEFAKQIAPSVQSGYLAIWERLSSVPKRYVRMRRDMSLTADAEELEAMLKDGVILESGDGSSDDRAYLVTTDPVIAKKYGLWPEDEFFDDDAVSEEPKP